MNVVVLTSSSPSEQPEPELPRELTPSEELLLEEWADRQADAQADNPAEFFRRFGF